MTKPLPNKVISNIPASNWYALYTTPRAEKQVQNKLNLNGIECYLPLHHTPRVWSDRVKMVDMPLFNSYIFVHCKEGEVLGLIKVPGVVRVVFYDGRPAVIRQSEIDAIVQFLEIAEGKTLCTGDEVEILTGAMKSKPGKVMKIKKKYVVLRIEELAATVCVDIESVAPLKRIK